MDNIQPAIKIVHASRSAMLSLTKDLPVAFLNHIPPAFKNNLIWHMGHVLAIQQRIYIRSGVDTPLPVAFIRKFDMGTVPESIVGSEDIEHIRYLLIQQADCLGQDYNAGKFNNYQGYDSSVYPGLRINNASDAVSFIAFHDGLHLGVMSAILRYCTSDRN